MNTRWNSIDPEVVLAIHDQQIAEHGGKAGIRDIGLVEGNLVYTRLLRNGSAPDIYDIAAEWGCCIARTEGFVDGNKRTAYVVTRLFLRLNGLDFSAPEVERLLVFEGLSNGAVALDEFAAWLRKYGSAVGNV